MSFISASLLLASLLFSPQGGQVSATANVDELVRNAQFIFRGTIQRVSATTVPLLPAGDDTVVVKVDEVILAPHTLNDFTNQHITVQLREARGMRVGESAIFFSNVFLYEKSIAVREVGRVSLRGDTKALRDQVTSASRRVADRALQQRLNLSSLVVLGKVSRVRRIEEGLRSRLPISEHDPEWWEAVVEIESVEKGEAPQRSVTILFPNSTDEMWYDSPKFREGQSGVFILQRGQQEKGLPAFRLPGYTALDPLDFQPGAQLNRIRTLIKSGG